MDYVFDFARGVIIFTVFTNLWEILIPKGKFAGYIRLILSFVLIAVIINPLGKLSGKDIFNMFEYNIKIADRELEMYDEKYYGEISREFEKRVVRQINESGIAVVKSCNAEISADENGIPVIVKTEIYAEEVSDEVREKIALYLGIDESRLIIRSAYEDIKSNF